MSKKNKDRGDRLRRLRERKGWEQKDLGDKIDVHFSHISKWEGGAGISRKHLINLASALETTMDFIEQGEEYENTTQERFSIDDSFDRLAGHVSEKGITRKDRDQLIAVLQDRANTLSKDLQEFSRMISALRNFDNKDDS